MAVTNEPTLNRLHDLEVSLELLSFAGGENTISEDHVCKADEARVCQNWDSISLGGMERSKGFNEVVSSATSGEKLSNGGFETWTGLTNLLTDGGLENWASSSNLTSWGEVGAGATFAQEGTIKKEGDYSCKITRSGALSYIYQDIASPSTYDGKTVVLGGWVKTSVANSARLFISTVPAASTYSSYHSGSGEWEYLSVVATLGTSLTILRASTPVAVDGDVYVDDLKLYEMLPPTDWTLLGAGATVAREEGTIKVGTYSAKVTRNGASSYIFQDIQSTLGINYWKGRTVTYGAWVYASVAETTFLTINDGVASSYSRFHSGTPGWEYLTVTKTISSSATLVRIIGTVVSVDTAAYFDGATVLEILTGPYDLLIQHDDVGGTETYGVIEGNLTKKSSSTMVTDDADAFTSGILCHAVSIKDNGLYITNSTDGLFVKTVGVAIAAPADVPPSECARIYNHKNRLLAEGSASYPNRVYGSRVGKGNWDEADAWTLANDAFSIDLPEDTRGLVPDFPSGDYVLCFTEKNAYALGNFPNAAFRVIGTPARGCSAPYSIAKGDEGVYFASTYPTKGIFLFDGASFAELTELNRDVFTDKIDFTKRIFGVYRNRRYYLFYNETGSGVIYPNTCRIYDARFKRWMTRPINSALSEAFGYPAVLNYASWELYSASSKSTKVYELETEDNSDEGENTEAVYTTKSFSSRDFAVASGGQFTIDDCRFKLLKLTIIISGVVGCVGFYWATDRGLHSGSKTIDLNQAGDLLNSTFIVNSSLLNATPQDKTRIYTFPNNAVGKHFYFQITNSGTGTRPKIKKIKVTALALPEE